MSDYSDDMFATLVILNRFFAIFYNFTYVRKALFYRLSGHIHYLAYLNPNKTFFSTSVSIAGHRYLNPLQVSFQKLLLYTEIRIVTGILKL